MALYKITHTCGHEDEVQIYGTNVHDERERKAEFLASRPCAECIAKEAARRREQAAAAAQADGMAVLRGSVKQVSWALDIRDEAIKAMRDKFEPNFPKIEDSKGREAARKGRENLARAVANAATVEDAKWFIDRRYHDGLGWFKDLYYYGQRGRSTER